MTGLAFLTAEIEPAGPHRPVWRSPLERALRAAPDGIGDRSRTGVLLVHGEVGQAPGATVVRLSRERTLVLCPPDAIAQLRATLGGVDVSAGYAGIAFEGERLLSRLTDLRVDALPAAGPIAGVPAVVLREGERFVVHFPQEYADHVGAVVLDAAEGLA